MRQDGRPLADLQRCADELTTMRVAPNVAWQIVNDEAIVIDLASGQVIGLNATATFLWSQLDGGDENALASAIANEFDVSEEAAKGDVRTFVDDMRRRNLIV